MNISAEFHFLTMFQAKGASTSSNIASNIAGNSVADKSTLSKFPATRSKIAGNTGMQT